MLGQPVLFEPVSAIRAVRSVIKISVFVDAIKFFRMDFLASLLTRSCGQVNDANRDFQMRKGMGIIEPTSV